MDGGRSADGLDALQGVLHLEVRGVGGPLGLEADGHVVQTSLVEQVEGSFVAHSKHVGLLDVKRVHLGRGRSGDVQADVAVLEGQIVGLQGPFEVKASLSTLDGGPVEEGTRTAVDDQARPEAGAV